MHLNNVSASEPSTEASSIDGLRGELESDNQPARALQLEAAARSQRERKAWRQKKLREGDRSPGHEGRR
jgi:hypothetical protein